MRFFTLLCVLLSGVCVAQYGQLDPTFDADGTAVVNLSNESWHGNAIAQQSTGAYVVAGSYTTSMGASHTLVLRLNPDGSLDPTFGPNNNGVLEIPVSPFLDEAVSVAVRPDDRIVVGGNGAFGFLPTMVSLGIDRRRALGQHLRYDGSVVCDSTGSLRVMMSDMVLDGTGSLVFCGDSPQQGGTVVRRDATGAPDLGFGNSGFAYAPSQAVNITGRSLTIDDQQRILLLDSTLRASRIC
ncbi:MAG: delta-60 repeat domain-containing protein [Flavobacteriales bacterium]|nr:delta-60 repeat domain-containing protein [Flavobacteriales bacterium]